MALESIHRNSMDAGCPPTSPIAPVRTAPAMKSHRDLPLAIQASSTLTAHFL